MLVSKNLNYYYVRHAQISSQQTIFRLLLYEKINIYYFCMPEGRMVRGIMVLRYSSIAVQRYSGTAVQRYSGIAVQRYSGTAV